MPPKKKNPKPTATVHYPPAQETINPLDGVLMETAAREPLHLVYEDAAHGIWLYNDNCLAVLDAIYEKYGEAGRFDMIFADPPYFLSNGGITCHAGKMVKVDKGEWDKSRGWEWNHEFNTEWLKRCQRVLKPNGTIWVTGTHHVIFSVGFAMQQLGFKILNDIAWEKPNPPPNLSCRYFTHSTETVLWAAKNVKSKHRFNYADMRKENGGKQMKTVWRMTAPGKAEKTFGKHPTQKPLTLVERCIRASTKPGDIVLDPFLGGGTTAVVSFKLQRSFFGIEFEPLHIQVAMRRMEGEKDKLFLQEIRVEIKFQAFCQNDLDPFSDPINWISRVAEKPEIQTEKIFHESKFVFLSCAQTSQASVVHTSVDVSVQSAWEHAPKSTKTQTTHIVRCETEIFRVAPAK